LRKKSKLVENFEMYQNQSDQVVTTNDVPMEEKNEKMDLNYGDSYLSIKSSYVVELKEEFVVYTKDGAISLEVGIIADLAKVPKEYRGVFINMMTSKYLNKSSVVNNPNFMNSIKDNDKSKIKNIFNKWIKMFF